MRGFNSLKTRTLVTILNAIVISSSVSTGALASSDDIEGSQTLSVVDDPSPGHMSLVAGSAAGWDGGPALIAPTFGLARSTLDVDSQGRVYFSDTYNLGSQQSTSQPGFTNVIRRIETDGRISTYYQSSTVIVDFKILFDSIYLFETGSDSIQRILPGANSTNHWVTFTPPGGWIFFGSGVGEIEVSPNNTTFVTYSAGFDESFQIFSIDKQSGEVSLVAGTGGFVDPELPPENSYGIPATEASNISFGEIKLDEQSDSLIVTTNHGIARIDGESGIITLLFAPSDPFNINGIDVTPSGDIVFTYGGQILRYLRDSDEVETLAGSAFGGQDIGGGPAQDVSLDPLALAMAPDESIYFANFGTPPTVRVFDPEQAFVSTVAGSPGFLQCASPTGSSLPSLATIKLDAFGRIHMQTLEAVLTVDPSLDAIYTSAGVLQRAGQTSDGAPAFGNPIDIDFQALTAAPDGTIYFADYNPFNDSLPIRRVDSETGILSTLAQGVFDILVYANGFVYAIQFTGGGFNDGSLVRIDAQTGTKEQIFALGDFSGDPLVVGETVDNRGWRPVTFDIDNDGNIYVYLERFVTHDSGNVLVGIYKIDAQTKVLSEISALDPQEYTINYSPSRGIGFAVDDDRGFLYYNNLYDRNAGEYIPVTRVNLQTGEQFAITLPNLSFSNELAIFGIESLSPSGLDISSNGELFLATRLRKNSGWSVVKITMGGALDNSTIPGDIVSGANVGRASARRDNWLAIGAPNVPGSGSNTGEVLVYQDNDCRPILRDRLKPPSGQSANRFGSRVTFADDKLVIGTSDESGSGSSSFKLGAYSLDSQGQNWSLSDDLSSDLSDVSGASDSNLVSDGRYFAVSTPQANGGEGEVVVFDARNLGNPRSVGPASGSLSSFGKSLALDGDRLAVGADSGSSTAVVQDFTRQGSQYVLNATTEGPANVSDYAAALAMEDDTLFVGAPDGSGGMVFDYTIETGELALNEVLSDPVDPSSSSFGAALAIEDGKLVVGAPDLTGVTSDVQSNKIRGGKPQNGSGGSGAVHTFGFKNRLRDRVETGYLFTRLADGREGYGRSLDIDNGRIVIGAPETDNNRGDFESAPDVVYSHELSGLWYDPELDGEGFNVLVSDNTMVIYFYGYDTEGERLWLIGTVSGTFRFGEDIYVDMFKAIDGDFGDPVPSDESLVKWGLLSMTYGSLDSATFILNGFDGTKISKAVFLLDAESNAALYSGLWYDASRDGEGYNVISGLPGTIIYYYGSTDNGQRLWLISDLLSDNISDGTTLSGTMYEAQGGDFYHPLPSNEALRSWGTINARFTDCDKGNFTLTGNDGSLSENVVKLAGLAGAECN